MAQVMQENWHYYHDWKMLSLILKSLDTINNISWFTSAIILYRVGSTCNQFCYTKTLFLITAITSILTSVLFKKCIKKYIHILQNEDTISQCLLCETSDNYCLLYPNCHHNLMAMPMLENIHCSVNKVNQNKTICILLCISMILFVLLKI